MHGVQWLRVVQRSREHGLRLVQGLTVQGPWVVQRLRVRGRGLRVVQGLGVQGPRAHDCQH